MIKRQLFYGYIIAISAFLIMIMWAGTRSAFGVFFKPIINEFGWSRALLSGAFSLLWVMLGLLSIIMGRLNDRFGPRIVVTICGLLMGLGHLLMSQLSTPWQLYLFYGVIVGIGNSIYVPVVSTVARWFLTRRGTVTGIVVAGGGLGSFLIPPLTNWLITTYDWRIAFVILGIMVLVIVVIASQFLIRDPLKKGLLPYGGTEANQDGFKLESKELTLKEAVHTRQFKLLVAILFLIGFCAYSIQLHIVPHATDLGISAIVAAQILAVIGGFIIIGRVVLGSISDTLGNEKAYIIGFVLLLAALLWLISANEPWMLYLFAIVFGFATGVGALTSPVVAGFFGLSTHGVIVGLLTFSYCMGGAIGPFISGYIFDITGNYQMMFAVNIIIAILGLVSAVLLTLNKIKPQGEQ